MKSISAEALSLLTQQKGGQPLNIVEVQWTDATTIYYADRYIPEFGIQGKILTLDDLENVVNLTGSSSSQSVSITLDDIDGGIKNIYNFNDLHKRPVKVYQWFDGLSFNDKFMIFEGEINSPIVWKESDRTISFQIVSKLEDKEVGFSPEEGTFASIADDLIGKAWPLPFGTCLYIPCIRLDPIPSGVNLEPNLIEDPSLSKQIADIGKRLIDMLTLIRIYNNGVLAAQSSAEGVREGSFESGTTADEYDSLADQWTDKMNELIAERAKLFIELSNLISQLSVQRGFIKRAIKISTGDCFPQNQAMTARINGVKHTGSFSGDNFNVSEATAPSEEGQQQTTTTIAMQSSITIGGQDAIQKVGFTWVPAGSSFKVESEMPVRFIIACIPVTVLNVWSHKRYNSAQVLTRVPPEYFSVSYQAFGTIVATIITLFRPLSHIDQGWEDDIFVDVQSPVGPNTVSIMEYLITTYTSLGIDGASFAQVAARVDPFPSNFCLFDRKNIVALLSEMAYQARCAIWIKNNTFYLRYLVDEPTPVDTFTKNDILMNTLEIDHTPTESLITKMVASYRTNYGVEKPNKIIVRNNVVKYGTHEEEKDWYIYNLPEAVHLAVTYWIIRKSNTWKILRFQTPMSKLRVETFDAITLNFSTNYASTGSVTGIVQSVKYNSADFTMEFEVWIPVRLGEMSKYDFAWPVDSEVNVYPNAATLAGSGGPGQGATGTLEPINGGCVEIVAYKAHKFHDKGHHNPGTRSIDGTVVLQPFITGLSTQQRPTSDYNYTNTRVPDSDISQTRIPKTVPAQIVSGDGPEYKVKAYIKGLEGETSNVKAKNVDHKDKLAADTWIMLMIVVWTEKNSAGKLEVKSKNLFLPSTSKPGTFPAKVISGSGTTYTMAVYKNGISNPPETIAGVKQLQIDPTDAIPAETWALVSEGVKNPPGEKEYTMQVAVAVE